MMRVRFSLDAPSKNYKIMLNNQDDGSNVPVETNTIGPYVPHNLTLPAANKRIAELEASNNIYRRENADMRAILKGLGKTLEAMSRGFLTD